MSNLDTHLKHALFFIIVAAVNTAFLLILTSVVLISILAQRHEDLIINFILAFLVGILAQISLENAKRHRTMYERFTGRIS